MVSPVDSMPQKSTSKPDSENTELFIKPLTQGWKREVVKRLVTDKKKPQCDVYYYHPNGKKLRSMNEIRANLTDGLTAECFTFRKLPLNVTNETVRNARDSKVKKKNPSKSKKADKSTNSPKPKPKKVQKQKKESASKEEAEEKPLISQKSKRQAMIQKKNQLKAVMNLKKAKQTKGLKQQKKGKKPETKSKGKGAQKSKAVKNSPPKKKTKKKAVTPVKKSKGKKSPIKTKQNSSRDGDKEENALSKGSESPPGDLKSIVKKNIGKYREMRKNEMLKRLKEFIKLPGSKNSTKSSPVKRTNSLPISNNLETYMKPLYKGWRRELVYRMNGVLTTGQSDVYYYDPNGRKFRSSREVSENLTPGLSADFFTFRKEPLGCGEPLEMIRNARCNSNSGVNLKQSSKSKRNGDIK